MFRFALRCVPVLIVLWMLPLLLIRAQPYDDRASRALVPDNCAMPCFLRIRPGMMSMSDAVNLVGGHEWVANGPLGFPALIRDAVQFGSVVPRTMIDLRWTENLPEWIDETRNGTLVVEDQRVLGLMIDTHLSLGEIFLTFGEPDAAWYSSSGSQQFAYSAWYAGQGVFVSGQGLCPARRYYNFQVRVVFSPDEPNVFEDVPRQAVC